jgi:hypothetical protein
MLLNILCTAFMFNYQDTINGPRQLLALFFNKKWFLSGFLNSARSDLTLIAGGETDGLQNIYATNGTSLFQLFANANELVDWTMVSAYWDEGDPTTTKQVVAFGFELDIGSGVSGTINVTLDTLENEPPYSQTQSYPVAISSTVQWINNSNNVVTWINNALNPVDWVGGGYLMNLQDGSNFGKYYGVTMQSSDVIGSINSAMFRYMWRQQW